MTKANELDQPKDCDVVDQTFVTGRDTRKVISQMRQYVHRNDSGIECRANGHSLTMWANTLEQEKTRQDDRLEKCIALLRTVATDIHNEAARISHGGRLDIETMTAWHELIDATLEDVYSSR